MSNVLQLGSGLINGFYVENPVSQSRIQKKAFAIINIDKLPKPGSAIKIGTTSFTFKDSPAAGSTDIKTATTISDLIKNILGSSKLPTDVTLTQLKDSSGNLTNSIKIEYNEVGDVGNNYAIDFSAIASNAPVKLSGGEDVPGKEWVQLQNILTTNITVLSIVSATKDAITVKEEVKNGAWLIVQSADNGWVETQAKNVTKNSDGSYTVDISGAKLTSNATNAVLNPAKNNVSVTVSLSTAASRLLVQELKFVKESSTTSQFKGYITYMDIGENLLQAGDTVLLDGKPVKLTKVTMDKTEIVYPGEGSYDSKLTVSGPFYVDDNATHLRVLCQGRGGNGGHGDGAIGYGGGGGSSGEYKIDNFTLTGSPTVTISSYTQISLNGKVVRADAGNTGGAPSSHSLASGACGGTAGGGGAGGGGKGCNGGQNGDGHGGNGGNSPAVSLFGLPGYKGGEGGQYGSSSLSSNASAYVNGGGGGASVLYSGGKAGYYNENGYPGRLGSGGGGGTEGNTSDNYQGGSGGPGVILYQYGYKRVHYTLEFDALPAAPTTCVIPLRGIKQSVDENAKYDFNIDLTESTITFTFPKVSNFKKSHIQRRIDISDDTVQVHAPFHTNLWKNA